MLIGARALLGREAFSRSASEPVLAAAQSAEGPLEVTLFELVDAFRGLLQRIPAESFHDVAPGDSLSIADCINDILSQLQERDTISFDDLTRDDQGSGHSRERIIVTFLALLELCRLKLIRIFQGNGYGSIWFVPAVVADPAVPSEVVYREL